MATATAVTPATVLDIDKKETSRMLHAEHTLSDRFITYMLQRNIRTEEDLIDQVFNSSEKRLARTLLLLARYGKEDKPQRVIPKISQETLAEMEPGPTCARDTDQPNQEWPSEWSAYDRQDLRGGRSYGMTRNDVRSIRPSSPTQSRFSL